MLWCLMRVGSALSNVMVMHTEKDLASCVMFCTVFVLCYCSQGVGEIHISNATACSEAVDGSLLLERVVVGSIC